MVSDVMTNKKTMETVITGLHNVSIILVITETLQDVVLCMFDLKRYIIKASIIKYIKVETKDHLITSP